jgi:hypothetical protein
VEYSFPRYLLAKQTVDDRALNRHVLEVLRANLPRRPIRVIEVGAGMGNMLARLLSWGVITRAEYIHEDAMSENIRFAAEWIPQWAVNAGMTAERPAASELRISDATHDVRVLLKNEEVFEFIGTRPAPADLLVANAFLDLLPMPESLPKLLSLTKDLAWLTVNFDGVTSLEPEMDAALDEKIERLYHRTMDTRPTGGDSRAGRHLLSYFRRLGARVLAAGPSDWVVYATGGKYPADEAYFLSFILHFFEESLANHPELDAAQLASWLEVRRAQIARGELSYIAHQIDLLVRV